MLSSALRDVPTEVLVTFKGIRRVMRELPDMLLGRGGPPKPVTSHVLCRALAKHFPVSCRDGYFGGGSAAHSWLRTGAGLIIDPHPPSLVGGPVMVLAEGSSPWTVLYREADLAPFIDPFKPAFDRHVASVADVVYAVLRADERYDC